MNYLKLEQTNLVSLNSFSFHVPVISNKILAIFTIKILPIICLSFETNMVFFPGFHFAL